MENDCPITSEGIKRNGQIDDKSLEKTIIDKLTSSVMQYLKRQAYIFDKYCSKDGNVKGYAENAKFKLGLMSYIGGVKLADQMNDLCKGYIPFILPSFYHEYIECAKEQKEYDANNSHDTGSSGSPNGIKLRAFWGVACTSDIYNVHNSIVDAYTEVFNTLINVNKLEKDIREYIKHNYSIQSKTLQDYDDSDETVVSAGDEYNKMFASLPKTIVFDINGHEFTKKFIISMENEWGVWLDDEYDRQQDSKYFRKNLHKPNLPMESEES